MQTLWVLNLSIYTNCRVVDVEFYNFFKSYRLDFDEIKNDFLTLQRKLDKYGELFSKYTNLENFTTSPKPKRKGTKQSSISSSPKNLKASNEANKAVPSSSAIDPPINSSQILQKPMGINPIVICEKSSDLSVPNNTVNQPHTFDQPLNSDSNQSSNNNISELMVFSPNPSSNTETMDNPTIFQKGNQFSSASNPKPLRVIPPLKTIFASRFAVDTSVLDVEFFIKNSISQDFHGNIKVFKINSRNRASFKIIVPDALFDRLVNPNFWPKNTIVREFEYRNNDIVTLPSVPESRPKN